MKIFKFKHPFIMKSSPFKMESEGEKLVDDQVKEFTTIQLKDSQSAGTVPGMFAIPMGIYNRYQDYKKSIEEQGPQTLLDPKKIESYKYPTKE